MCCFCPFSVGGEGELAPARAQGVLASWAGPRTIAIVAMPSQPEDGSQPPPDVEHVTQLSPAHLGALQLINLQRLSF